MVTCLGISPYLKLASKSASLPIPLGLRDILHLGSSTLSVLLVRCLGSPKHVVERLSIERVRCQLP